jgi:hypothetical protein
MKILKIKSGHIRFGDPVHQDNQFAIILSAKTGDWKVSIKTEEKYNNKTIVRMEAEIEDDFDDYAKAMSMILGKTETLSKHEYISKVESGVAGFFDNSTYMLDQIFQEVERQSGVVVCEDQPFYSICCDRALSEDKWGEVPYGCVCSVPVEGFYNITAFSNNSGKVIKIVADFSETVDGPIQNGEDGEVFKKLKGVRGGPY